MNLQHSETVDGASNRPSERRHGALVITLLGVGLPIVLLCGLALFIAVARDDGVGPDPGERPKFIHTWAR
jgi:hypothetical protein